MTRRLLLYASIILFGVGLLVFSRETSSAATDALKLCAGALIPSLFPFFVVSDMAINSGLSAGISRLFRKPMKLLFNLPGECAAAFILGIFGGYPVGAGAACSTYKSGLCTKAEAERLLSFCNNCGPAFILGVCGAVLFGQTATGVLLYVCHILASITCGVLFRFYKPKDCSLSQPCASSLARKQISPRKLFIASVKSSAHAMINICAYVIFFSVAVRLLGLFGVIPMLARGVYVFLRPLGLDLLYAERLVSGIFEVTAGVYGIASSGAYLSAQLCAAAFMLGWAGLSVHFQVLDFIVDSNLSSKPYMIGKLLHGVLSAIYVYIGTCIIPFDAQVSKLWDTKLSAITSASPSALLGFSAVCSIFIVIIMLIVRKPLKGR